MVKVRRYLNLFEFLSFLFSYEKEGKEVLEVLEQVEVLVKGRGRGRVEMVKVRHYFVFIRDFVFL